MTAVRALRRLSIDMASSPCAVMDTPRRALCGFVLLRERPSAPSLHPGAGGKSRRVVSSGASGRPLRREAKDNIAPFPVTRRIYFRGGMAAEASARRACFLTNW
jgi:hypothetical protein